MFRNPKYCPRKLDQGILLPSPPPGRPTQEKNLWTLIRSHRPDFSIDGATTYCTTALLLPPGRPGTASYNGLPSMSSLSSLTFLTSLTSPRSTKPDWPLLCMARYSHLLKRLAFSVWRRQAGRHATPACPLHPISVFIACFTLQTG